MYFCPTINTAAKARNRTRKTTFSSRRIQPPRHRGKFKDPQQRRSTLLAFLFFAPGKEEEEEEERKVFARKQEMKGFVYDRQMVMGANEM